VRRSPPSSGCTRSAPTATSASASSTGTGKREQAQEHFTAAMTMYREMDMRFWLDQAETALGSARL
jgi:hypothetical protein